MISGVERRGNHLMKLRKKSLYTSHEYMRPLIGFQNVGVEEVLVIVECVCIYISIQCVVKINHNIVVISIRAVKLTAS